MKPSAALLIDLENFYLSRIDHFNDEKFRAEDRPSFAEDLKNLVRHAHRMAGLPFAVRRAYADFDSLNVNPQELMRQGVEPVQVFRLSGKSANKNAADMKLAMDAIALLGTGAPIEHFVLVSGDADFIPVILELKRRGHTVSVIAVTGATNELIQRFVDKFELFENLVAAAPERRERAPAADDLPKIAAAVRRALGRARPVRITLVQHLLSKELGHTFDPGAYGSDTTVEFVRKNAAALGVVLRGAPHEQEVDLAGAPAPSTNGSNGSKSVARQTPRTTPVERQPAAPEPHSPVHYRQLLASGRADANEARVLVVPWASLVWVCDAVVPALTPPTGAPATSMELMLRLQTAARATGVPDLAAHVALIHSAVRCSLPVPPVPGGVHTLAEGTTGDDIRRRLLSYVVYVLGCRLSENSVSGPIRAESVAAMFEPGPATERATAEITAALAPASAEPATPPAPVPVVAPKVPRADDGHVHTPDGYRKLLQKGGPRGSGDTEHLRVHTAPWPSIERACADTFAALSPVGTVLQRGQFLERLYASEKEMCVENYRSHMRRAFALLVLSHAVLEDGDRVTLHPEVAEPGDIRWAVLGTMLQVLAVRLSEKGVADPVRPDVFVAAIEAGPFTDVMVPEITRAVECMYRAADAGDTDPAPEQVATEPVTAELVTATDAQLDVADAASEPLPVPDAVESANEPVAGEPVVSAEPVQAQNAEPSWGDPFAFDGAIPEYATTAPAPAPTAAEEEPFVTPAEPTDDGSDVDVGAITSAMVAAVVEPAVQVIPVAESAAPPDEVPIARPDPELVVFAPPLEVEPAPANEALPIEVPVADWVSDDDSIFSPSQEFAVERLTGSSTRLAQFSPRANEDDDVYLPGMGFDAEQIVERLTGSSTRLAPLPKSAETRTPVTKITLPPLPPSDTHPPTPPPETA